MKITIYGDSILKGVLLENGRYRSNSDWEKKLSDELGLSIQNRSRFGCTIQKALPFLRRDNEAPAQEKELVLLELGGNDCDYDWQAISQDPHGRYRCKTPPELFAGLYREAINLIRGSGRTPVALNLPPIHSERYLSFLSRDGLSRQNILSWLGDVEAITRWQHTYSDLIVQLAREEQVQLLDLRGIFPTEQRDLEPWLCQDGIHPSLDGQKHMYQLFRSRARELLPV